MVSSRDGHGSRESFVWSTSRLPGGGRQQGGHIFRLAHAIVDYLGLMRFEIRDAVTY